MAEKNAPPSASEARVSESVRAMQESILDQMEGVYANIRAGAQGFTSIMEEEGRRAGEKIRSVGDILGSFQSAVGNLTSSLHKIGGGGNSGFTIRDITAGLISHQTTVLGGKLDKVEVAVRTLKLGGSAAWA